MRRPELIASFFSVLLLSLPSAQASTTSAIPSQSRLPDETVETAYQRYSERSRQAGRGFSPASAYGVATPLAQLDLASVPSLGSYAAVERAFHEARDPRYMALPENPGFKRRASWLYPDDGCFARAAMTGRELVSFGEPRPKKLFIFGQLAVKTPNAEGGWVYWWYHVVPVVSDGAQAYVLDPSIEPARPLPIQDWARRMVPGVSQAKFSLCGSYSYEPGSSCSGATASTESSALTDQFEFLRLEWDRVAGLGRDPKKELGDSPPWKLPSDR